MVERASPDPLPDAHLRREISRIVIVDATTPQPVALEEVELPGSPMWWIGHGAVTCGGWPGEKRKGPQHCFQHCGPEKRPLHC